MNQASYGIVEFKADTDGPLGLFAAKVSGVGNVDRNGDRIMEGAWDGTVGRWQRSGKHIPVVWSHDHKNPQAFIGSVDPSNITILADGVIMAGRLDVETNPLAARAWDLLNRGLVGEWSFAYSVNKERIGKDGAREVLDLDLFEVGPTLIGANPLTATLSVASAQGPTTSTTPPTSGATTSTVVLETVESKQVDNSAWDGSEAMAACDSAADFRSVCAGERSVGDPDERQHWALPHHKSPGAAPNANGVRNALARIGQTQGLVNKEAAQGHLDRHMASISSEASAEAESKIGASVEEAVAEVDRQIDVLVEEKIGKVISRRTKERIQRAMAELQGILSSLDEQEVPTVSEDSPSETKEVQAAPPSENELRRREMERSGLFLSERGRG